MSSEKKESGLDNIKAFVKGTLSGDTLIISHLNKVLEKTISLAYIQSPEMGKPNSVEKPFAFAARELVRKACIGKRVTLSVQYTHPRTKRDYCKVFVDGKDLGLSLLNAGYAYINHLDVHDDEEKYDVAQGDAKRKKVGVWGSKKQLDKSIREVFWSGYDTNKIFESYGEKKNLKVIVEYVVNGSTLKVLLPTNDIVTVHMTGIQCPPVNVRYVEVKSDEKKENYVDKNGEKRVKKKRIDNTPEFGHAARHFTEARLLHRDVVLVLEGIDKFDNFFGTVMQNKKPFQESLLNEGFAKIAEWNVSRSEHVQQLRSAENAAKVSKKRLWKDYKPPKSSLLKSDKGVTKVTIIELISGDTLKVQKKGRDPERVSLSSIRCNRFIRNKEPEEFAYEARELLRSKCAAKKILMKVDYRRSFPRKGKNGEEKNEIVRFVSLFAGGKNVALDLVNAGYATVIRHRPNEERSSIYDKLVQAEYKAEESKRGLFSDYAAPLYRMNDISYVSASKAQAHFGSLKDKPLKAIVEKVHSGSRMRISIPKESLIITFSISGVTTPNKDAKYAKESKNFTNSNLILKEVDVLIDYCDKFGNFLGQLIDEKKDYAVDLLQTGLAYLNGSARKLKNYEALAEAENIAREKKIKLFSLTFEERDPAGYKRVQERKKLREQEKKKT